MSAVCKLLSDTVSAKASSAIRGAKSLNLAVNCAAKSTRACCQLFSTCLLLSF